MKKEEHNRCTSMPFLALVLAVLAVLVHLFLVAPHHRTRLPYDSFSCWTTFLIGCREGNRSNPYLMNNFAPVQTEHRNVPVRLIQGKIPPSLHGVFLRNGPNPSLFTHTKKRHHWFDGNGMLHSLRLYENGTATYSNSMIPTPRYRIERQYKREIFFKLGELTGITGLLKLTLLNSLKQKLFHTTKLTRGQANTHILLYQNHLYALHEASLPFEITLLNDASLAAEKGLCLLTNPFTTNSIILHQPIYEWTPIMVTCCYMDMPAILSFNNETVS